MRVNLATITKEEILLVKDWEQYQWLLMLLQMARNWKKATGRSMEALL